MITTIEPGRYFTVTGTCRNQVSSEVDAVVELAKQHAKIEGWMGVLVTRHDPITYTVALSPNIAYGAIVERDAG